MVIAIMLILVAGASYMLVKKFNANAQRARADVKTMQALKTAKQTLISYAVSYPDNVNPDFGPGHLLCPDTTNDGFAGTFCEDNNDLIGRYPYRTLEVPELRDGNGQRLWYALSANYSNNPKTIPMNSDVVGELQVDNIEDVVAIVFAAGEPVGDQGNRGSVAENIEDYLEGENANLDQVFTRSGGADFNDRLVIITRDELMAAVEKRVLGDVSRILNNYHASHDALPWLSPYSDPVTSAFRGTVDTYAGHVPFHWRGDEPGETNRNPFDTSIGWIWHTDPGTATGYWDGTVTPECLRNVDCDDDENPFPLITAVEKSSISCEWSNKETVNCEESGWISMPSQTNVACAIGLPTPCLGECTREYMVEFPEYSGTSSITTPSSSTVRRRDVELIGDIPAKTRAVEIRDQCRSLSTGNTVPIGTGYINFTSDTTGTIETLRIQYDIDADGDELPGWFVENEWHEMVYVAYPESEDYPGTNNGSACNLDPSKDCLVLHYKGNSDPLYEDIRVLVLLSGREINDPDLGLVQERPSSDLDDYFEESDFGGTCGASSICNYDASLDFVSGKPTGEFNDRVRVLKLN